MLLFAYVPGTTMGASFVVMGPFVVAAAAAAANHRRRSKHVATGPDHGQPMVPRGSSVQDLT
jgi:hypothetical protein